MPAPLLIVQARFSSQRLPGKVLRPLHGKPMLAWLLESLHHCRAVSGIVLATSVEDSDDPVAAFAQQYGVDCFRGPLDDVALRFLDCAEMYDAEAFVRVSGDSPLMDPALIDRAATLFQAAPCDLASNVLVRSFPKGFSVEVVAVEAMRRAYGRMTTPGHHEHVTSLFYDRPQDWRITGFTSGQDWGTVQMSVDTAEDFAAAEALVAAMDRPPHGYGVAGLMDLRERVLG